MAATASTDIFSGGDWVLYIYGGGRRRVGLGVGFGMAYIVMGWGWLWLAMPRLAWLSVAVAANFCHSETVMV